MRSRVKRLLKRVVPPALRPPLKRLWGRRRRVAAVGAGLVLVAAIVAALVLGVDRLVVVGAVVVVLAALLAVEARRAQRAEAALRREVAALDTAFGSLVLALWTGTDITAIDLPPALAQTAASALLERGDPLGAHALATRVGLASLSLTTRRRLWYDLEKRGYLARAQEVAATCPARTPDERRRQQRLAGEIAVLSGAFVPRLAPVTDYAARPGRVLHLVGNSLPVTQSGYTLRTHYTALAQQRLGLDPHVVTQMGFAHEGNDYPTELVEGITYHRVPGPTRASLPLDQWLDTHIQRVATVVRKVHPAVLHAASDYLNAITAETIGHAYGIPVVYESRGFWEETWLSRQADTHHWDLTQLEATHGLPDTYLWRRDIEDRARRDADRVVTLADVMAERIHHGGVPRDHITVVPNGVDTDAFPIQTRNTTLAHTLGITDDTTVIGYITSIVEYEGIDTLIDAYATLQKTTTTPTTLLIVGDGPVRQDLQNQAHTLGLTTVIFTGRVPHDQVIDYYSLIDIFVVPRKPVEVCHLVTPLKPFEAFATGRTLVMSNVRALAAIAHASNAAELFEAGDPTSLATTLTTLLHNPDHQKTLATTGATWVRQHRTWTANATTYLHLYTDMGAILTEADSERAALSPAAIAAAPALAGPPRPPQVLARATELDLSGSSIEWLPCELAPGQLYRVTVEAEGGPDTRDLAAVAIFDLDDARAGGEGLRVSRSAGGVATHLYLRTGPGRYRTDKTFQVASPAHRLGLRRWHDRGQVTVRSVTVESAAIGGVDFFFSFDVEANPVRAIGDSPIDSLVWGKVGGGEFGIARLCDVLEQHTIVGNFMVDVASCAAEGEAKLAKIIDYLGGRGHEVHLHLHPEDLDAATQAAAGAPAGWSRAEWTSAFRDGDHDLSRRLVEGGMTAFERCAGRAPRVFRSGSYLMSGGLIQAAGELGLDGLTNVHRTDLRDPGLAGGDVDADLEPFAWPNGVIELPVDVSSPEAGMPRKYLSTYNRAIALKRFERTFNLVMHSWSLTRRNEQGRHDAFAPHIEARLHAMCEHAIRSGRARGYAEYLDAAARDRRIQGLDTIVVPEPS